MLWHGSDSVHAASIFWRPAATDQALEDLLCRWLAYYPKGHSLLSHPKHHPVNG